MGRDEREERQNRAKGGTDNEGNSGEAGEPTPEERAALRAVESLERRAPSHSEEWELERGFLELVGLLPYELDPVAPAPETRRRLLAEVRGDIEEAPVVPFARPESAAPVTPVPSRSAGAGLAMAIAAALALLTVGLGGWGGWLSLRLAGEQATVDRLEARVQAQAVEMAALEEIRAELASLEERFTVVTSSDVRICPLSATNEVLEQPKARARVYMSQSRHGWVLAADDVEPCPQGRSFHVWFRTEAGVVSGGSFSVEKGQRIEIDADNLPDGTSAVLVTLETEKDPPAPTGPTVFYGDETHVL